MTISADLLALQQANNTSPLCKLVITGSAIPTGSATYTGASTANMILKAEYTETPYSHKAEIVLDNSDVALNALDFKGYPAVLSYGSNVASSTEYVDRAKMYVKNKQLLSVNNRLLCYVTLMGIPDRLAKDKASVTYQPSANDGQTIKTIVGKILASSSLYNIWVAASTYAVGDWVRPTAAASTWAYYCTVAGTTGASEPAWTEVSGSTMADSAVSWRCDRKNNPYGHCTSYDVDWTGEDSLITSVKPNATFRIYENQTRLNALKWLFDRTNCVMKFSSTGQVKIVQPVTTGTTYDYSYALTAGHTFFNKGIDAQLVIPNKITVSSNADDTVQVQASATSGVSYARVPTDDFIHMTLTGANTTEMTAMASSIASAVIKKSELNAQQGSGRMLMNVDSDVYDYVSVADPREADTCIGNIGYQKMIYNPKADAKDERWYLDIAFGSYLSQEYKELISNLENEPTSPFPRIIHGDMFIESIHADNLDFVWLDPANNIDLSLIGDNLDGLADGATYARVKATALNASGMVTTDALIDGTYAKVLQTSVSAGHIKLTSDTKVDGKWYSQHGVDIAASVGINIYGENNALVTRATETGTIQCSVNAAGQITAGAGAVLLDATGVTIKDANNGNQWLNFADTAGNEQAQIYLNSATTFVIQTLNSKPMNISVPANSLIITAGSFDLLSQSTPFKPRVLAASAASTANVGDGELVIFNDTDTSIAYLVYRAGTAIGYMVFGAP